MKTLSDTVLYRKNFTMGHHRARIIAGPAIILEHSAVMENKMVGRVEPVCQSQTLLQHTS